ncbi:GlxA family transcriptional regulator [Marinomonas sp. GJ51-6]|uniref:GlxA family transcriptional regulator n=1 Tax=Marinomonas sp. GJ51-6 TaxID=2992802 RepID=UPI0029351FC3|nr:helix-turn-helix domain-containing protein [Marinomonas sp. GJ51-6]WOD08633.1 helix-turn-helix domain-containing protein [Marinomonas sp. GJ51-6]
MSVAFILCENFIFKYFSDFINVLNQINNDGIGKKTNDFSWSVLGEKNKPIRSSCHIDLLPRNDFERPDDYDCIVIIGGTTPSTGDLGEKAAQFITEAHQAKIPLVGIASGRHVLASHNLLDGRKCAVDALCELKFRSIYPEIETVSYEPFVVDSQLVTCPGDDVLNLASTLMRQYFDDLPEQTRQRMETRKNAGISSAECEAKYNIDINQVIEFMENNLSVPMSMKELAEQLDTSPSQLDGLFMSNMGMTPSFVWRKLRLERAYWLLVNTQQKITDIALECGYYDSAHFNKVFKSSFSVSPKIVRREGVSLTGFHQHQHQHQHQHAHSTM